MDRLRVGVQVHTHSWCEGLVRSAVRHVTSGFRLVSESRSRLTGQAEAMCRRGGAVSMDRFDWQQSYVFRQS